MAGSRFASVVFPIASRQGDQLYSYRIPQGLAGRVRVGCWVEAPLRSRQFRGWVVELGDTCPVAEVRDITRVVSDIPAFNEELFALCRWIAKAYLCPLGIVLKSLGPAWLGREDEKGKQEVVRLAVPPAVAENACRSMRRAPKQAQVLAALLAHEPGVGLRSGELGADRRILRSLKARGLVTLEKTAGVAGEGEECPEPVPTSPPLCLNAGQATSLATIKHAIQAGRFQAILLHGVTGSGKTEVYLQAIAATIALGRQAILLVPEIALTPQMVGYLQERFGSQVAVLHSGLRPQERSRAWQRLARGQASVAVGARSSVFAPVSRLGLIVVDEEHESSYKQEDSPRYHTRDVVLKRAQLASAVVVLGSATPSLESFYWAERGLYQMVSLPERIDGRAMPEVKIIDMRQEVRHGNRGILSRYLCERISDVLPRGEQVLLFLNRRGYHTFLLCRNCGEVLRCRSCDITLTYHRQQPALRCHYCGFTLPRAPACPACGAETWQGLGSGTQRVEGELKQRWPGVRVLRLDADAVGHRGAHEQIYQAFRRGEADVLVGTQMATKGFNFPLLTLVGVVNADVTLNLPDFRARERTFQLLTQVGGRAGRGEKSGEMVVQTFFPDDYSIQAVRTHDYRSFYRQELRQRRQRGYPPFGHLVLLVVTAPKVEQARTAAEELGRSLKEHAAPGVSVLGPAPAPLARLEDRYRYQLILKGSPVNRLREVAMASLAAVRPRSGVRITVDVDPLLMM